MGTKAHRRALQMFIALGTLAATGFTLASPAVASTAQSSLKNLGTINGYTYANRAFLDYQTSDIPPVMTSKIGATAVAPIGYMGARARVFVDGTWCSNDYSATFNVQPEQQWSESYAANCGAGDYSSIGFTYELQQDTQYRRDLTYETTPLVYFCDCVSTVASDASLQVASSDPYPTNALGETYGSGEASSKLPDLIRAFASNGQVGFVRSSDVARYDNTPTTLSEAKNQMHLQSLPSELPRIPVYESDGVTQIGSFTIGGHGFAWTLQDQSWWDQYCSSLVASSASNSC